MNSRSRKEYIETIFLRCKKAFLKEKPTIPKEFNAFHRKYAIRQRSGDLNALRDLTLKPKEMINIGSDLLSGQFIQGIAALFMTGPVWKHSNWKLSWG